MICTEDHISDFSWYLEINFDAIILLIAFWSLYYMNLVLETLGFIDVAAYISYVLMLNIACSSWVMWWNITIWLWVWSEPSLHRSSLIYALLGDVSVFPLGSGSCSSCHLCMLLGHLQLLLLTAGSHVREHTQHRVADLVRLRETHKEVCFLFWWGTFMMLYNYTIIICPFRIYSSSCTSDNTYLSISVLIWSYRNSWIK